MKRKYNEMFGDYEKQPKSDDYKKMVQEKEKLMNQLEKEDPDHVKNIGKWSHEMYEVTLKAREFYDNNEILKTKSILENAIFQLISDLPGHYNLLHEIYRNEGNIEGLHKLKRASLDEVRKTRNKVNGSDKKFTRTADEILFSINFNSFVQVAPNLLVENEKINKKQMTELMAIEFSISNEQSLELYNHVIENNIIKRVKIGNRYQHYMK